MASDDLVISAGIRAARAILGWSQKELASRSRVSVPSINRFERGEGEARMITVTRLMNCLERHGVRIVVTSDAGLQVLVTADAMAQVVHRSITNEAITPRGKFGPRKKVAEGEGAKE